jgi:hypothetical protein
MHTWWLEGRCRGCVEDLSAARGGGLFQQDSEHWGTTCGSESCDVTGETVLCKYFGGVCVI